MTEDDTFRALKKKTLDEMKDIIQKNNILWAQFGPVNETPEAYEAFNKAWSESNLKKLKENGWTETEYLEKMHQDYDRRRYI